MRKEVLVLVVEDERIVFRHVRGNMWHCDTYNFNCFSNDDLHTDLIAALNSDGIYPEGKHHWEGRS